MYSSVLYRAWFGLERETEIGLCLRVHSTALLGYALRCSALLCTRTRWLDSAHSLTHSLTRSYSPISACLCIYLYFLFPASFIFLFFPSLDTHRRNLPFLLFSRRAISQSAPAPAPAPEPSAQLPARRRPPCLIQRNKWSAWRPSSRSTTPPPLRPRPRPHPRP